MKSNRINAGWLMLLALSPFTLQPSTAQAQGTAFAYQGRLQNNGSPASGVYDFSFGLYDAASGGTQHGSTLTATGIGVTNGLFTVTLDFGNQFSGSALWLGISMRTNGAGTYTALSPRQPLMPTPYAVSAENLTGTLPASQLSGIVPLGQLPAAVVTNNSTGAIVVDPGGLNSGNLLPGLIFGGGNSGEGISSQRTSGTSQYGLGFFTASTLRMEISINGNVGIGTTTASRRLEVQQAGDTEIGIKSTDANAHLWTVQSSGVNGSTNLDGSFQIIDRTLGVSRLLIRTNGTVTAASFTGDGAGLTNLSASQLSSGTIGLAQLPGAVLTNNENNVTFNGAVTITNIHTPASRDFSLQAGNGSGSAGGNVSILAGSGTGGYTGGNIVLLPGTGTPNGSVGIGTTTPQFPLDIFSGSGEARINLNASSGRLGQINRRADRFEVLSTDAITLAPNSGVEAVRILSNGNVGIGTTAPAHPLEMASGAYCSAAGVWTSVSDRNAKEDFAPIVPGEVLAKVAALPITQWKYKVERDGIKHIGPVSQDFHAAFGLGDSEQAIGTVDETGVALAAIQGLNQKLNEKDAEIQGLKQSVAELKAMVEKLAAK